MAYQIKTYIYDSIADRQIVRVSANSYETKALANFMAFKTDVYSHANSVAVIQAKQRG
jgi:hypothetical protein